MGHSQINVVYTSWSQAKFEKESKQINIKQKLPSFYDNQTIQALISMGGLNYETHVSRNGTVSKLPEKLIKV